MYLYYPSSYSEESPSSRLREDIRAINKKYLADIETIECDSETKKLLMKGAKDFISKNRL